MMRQHDTHEPFSQTWTGIGMQLFLVAILIYITVSLWTR